MRGKNELSATFVCAAEIRRDLHSTRRHFADINIDESPDFVKASCGKPAARMEKTASLCYDRGMKVAIVGGGAAGLMAAATIQELDPVAEIFVLERNPTLGKKILLTGGGRCNVTTGLQDVRAVLAKYPRGGKFLSSAMHAFTPKAAYDWFEARGVPLKVEEDLRVFPISNSGKDIVGIFEALFRTPKTHLLLSAQVTRIEKQKELFVITIKGRQERLLVDIIILTTGGQAYRETGSTGDGYAFAASLGHTITPLAPSLNAFFTMETWPADLSGISFKHTTISAKHGKKASVTGPFLFTHKGVSGPAVFALSSLLAFASYEPKNPLEINIDLFPDAAQDAFIKILEEAIASQPKKSLLNALALIVPKSLAEVLCRALSIQEKKRAAECGKKDLLRIAGWLKGIPLRVKGRDAGDEFVTAGGVHLKEVNPSTMESLLCPGLFFAGEILDIDGFTGGFNLQSAWATGRLAGRRVAEQSLKKAACHVEFTLGGNRFSS